jgi:hypothetical protein
MDKIQVLDLMFSWLLTVTSYECGHVVRREPDVSEENIFSNFRVNSNEARKKQKQA